MKDIDYSYGILFPSGVLIIISLFLVSMIGE